MGWSWLRRWRWGGWSQSSQALRIAQAGGARATAGPIGAGWIGRKRIGSEAVLQTVPAATDLLANGSDVHVMQGFGRGFHGVPLLQPATHPARALLQPVPPAVARLEQLFADAGPGDGQIGKMIDRHFNPAGLLIHDPAGLQQPAAGSGQPRIAAGHQVVLNGAAAGVDGGISHQTQGKSVVAVEASAEQLGQQVEGGLLRCRRLAAHHRQVVVQLMQLIQTPHVAGGTKAERAAGPAQHPVRRRVHPHLVPHAEVRRVLVADASTQQITHQHLTGKMHEGVTAQAGWASPGR